VEFSQNVNLKDYFAAGLYSFLSITILAIKVEFSQKCQSKKLLSRWLVFFFIDHHLGNKSGIFAKMSI